MVEGPWDLKDHSEKYPVSENEIEIISLPKIMITFVVSTMHCYMED